jgi:hypothetical protein
MKKKQKNKKQSLLRELGQIKYGIAIYLGIARLSRLAVARAVHARRHQQTHVGAALVQIQQLVAEFSGGDLVHGNREAAPLRVALGQRCRDSVPRIIRARLYERE